MKTTKILLLALFMCSFSGIYAQGVNVSGVFNCWENTQNTFNGDPVIWMGLAGNGIITDTVAVPINSDGSFNYLFPTDGQGMIIISYVDANGMEQTVQQYFGPDSMTLYFTIDACDPIQSCNADFEMYIGALGQVEGDIYVVTNSTGTATGQLNYFWDFGDGSSGTGFSLAHYYANAGTYTLCLTIASADGCTDEYCEEFTVNADGSIVLGTGMIMQGFTLHINESATAINENSTNQFAVFPNPVSGSQAIRISSNDSWTGNVSVINMEGREISNINWNASKGVNALPVDCSSWSAGVYQLRMMEKNGQLETITLLKN